MGSIVVCGIATAHGLHAKDPDRQHTADRSALSSKLARSNCLRRCRAVYPCCKDGERCSTPLLVELWSTSPTDIRCSLTACRVQIEYSCILWVHDVPTASWHFHAHNVITTNAAPRDKASHPPSFFSLMNHANTALQTTRLRPTPRAARVAWP
jgi:hypothetical protein